MKREYTYENEEEQPAHKAAPPHPYRKYGKKVGEPPSNPDYPEHPPFDPEEWKKSHKKTNEEELNEISNEVLSKYKTAAGKSASAADAAGDIKKGNKRFSGIVKATKKQFDNDARARAAVKENNDPILAQ